MFLGRSENQCLCRGRSVKKVAHCTQEFSEFHIWSEKDGEIKQKTTKKVAGAIWLAEAEAKVHSEVNLWPRWLDLALERNREKQKYQYIKSY